MWPDGEGPCPSGSGRSSTGSEMMVINDQMAAASQSPVIANMNILRSTGTHIGNKFTTVTQNIHTNQVIKGGFLGFELVSPAHSKRLRCSVAVFVCWALVLASGLAFYFFFVSFAKTRIDIDLTLRQYLVDLVKNSTRAERISCGVAISLVLIGVILLVIYFTVIVDLQNYQPDEAPHEWLITRDDWLAQLYENDPIEARFEPLRLVVIQHSVSGECHRFDKCATELRVLQEYFITKKDRDVPYNFFVGNDGRVYEGRGWQKVGAHTRGYNLCSVGIGFIGDYREEKGSNSKITKAQENRTNLILEEGVRLGYLHPKYLIVAAMDVQTSESPGSNIYKAMQNWKHYDHEHRFSNKTCDQINAMPYFDE